jgi:Sulfotransferase domain
LARRSEPVSDDRLRLPTFIKQYGIERTGTNVLRALLEGYVGDVVVLMHVLGDKHSPPVDLRAVLTAVEGRPDAAMAFATAATRSAPSSTTDVPGDPRQLEHLRTLADDLYRAALEDDVRVAVSIRNPYEWARSMLVYQGRLHRREAVVDSDRLEPAVSSLCDRFNSCYSAWLALVAARPDGATVVRYEDLTGDLDPLVERLARALGLPGLVRAGARLPHVLGPAHWDDDPTVVVNVDFEQVSQSRRKRTPLPNRLLEAVTERIDWQLVAPYGYAPMLA